MNDKKVANPCGAKTRAGTPCKRIAGVLGRCNLHGGKSRKGISSPNWKHGRYSHWMTDLQATTVEAPAKDDTLTEMRNHIVLWDLRTAELFAMLPNDGAGVSWAKARDLFHQFKKAQTSGHLSAMRLALDELETVLQDGWLHREIWHDLNVIAEQRARFADREIRRQIGLFYMIPGKEAIALMNHLLEAVQRHVPDPIVLDAIQTEYSAILGRRSEARGTT